MHVSCHEFRACGLLSLGQPRMASGLLPPTSLVEGNAMFAILLQKLRKNRTEILFYLGTHGITVLLLMALLLGVVLLD